MINIQASQVINRPLSEVFEYVSDFHNNPSWQPIKQVKKLTSGPMRKGTKIRQVFDFRGARQHIDVEITDFKPAQKFSYKYVSPLASSNDEFHFMEVDGKTRVMISGKMKFPLLYRMSEPIVAPHLQKQAEISLRDLKQILESQKEDG